jgi:acyl-coenzyme A thioesterase 9
LDKRPKNCFFFLTLIVEMVLPNKEDSPIYFQPSFPVTNFLSNNFTPPIWKIIGSSTFISPVAAAAAAEANSPRNKVFTVRPITSWIDKLAQRHGSPTSTSAQGNADPNKKYSKRELVLKTMQQSYTEIILPFATDKALLEEYINYGGTVR